MSKCSVVGCKHSLRASTGIPMFCFPTNQDVRKKWIQAVKIDPQTIKESTKVCALHFSENDSFQFATRSKLKRGRVPHLNLGPIYNEIENETHNSEVPASRESKIAKESENSVTKKRRLAVRRSKILTHVISSKVPFAIEKFMNNNKKIFYYTGIPSFEVLLIIFNFVLKSENGPPGAVHQSTARGVKMRRHQLSPLNEMFLTLLKLRRGFDHQTLADMFNISVPSVSRIFSTWIFLLYETLGSMNFFPHRNILMEKAPKGFLQKYPNVIGSIDCTEFNIETPTSLLRNSQCFSHYKNTTTLKSLIMINATGAVIFVSSLYTGSISDKKILEESGFLRLLRKKIEIGELNHGDIVLADKGFNVKNLLQDIGIELNIPTFRITGMQFQPNEVEYIRKISHERIHVERAISRLKSFRILSHRIPISLLGIVNQIYTVCALLTNFRPPLRKTPDTINDSSGL